MAVAAQGEDAGDVCRDLARGRRDAPFDDPSAIKEERRERTAAAGHGVGSGVGGAGDRAVVLVGPEALQVAPREGHGVAVHQLEDRPRAEQAVVTGVGVAHAWGSARACAIRAQ